MLLVRQKLLLLTLMMEQLAILQLLLELPLRVEVRVEDMIKRPQNIMEDLVEEHLTIVLVV